MLSGGTLILPDNNIRNSDASWTHVLPATTNYVIADFKIVGTKGDNLLETIVEVPYSPAGYTFPKIRIHDQNDSPVGSGRIAKTVQITNSDIISVTENSTKILIEADIPSPSGIQYSQLTLGQPTSYRTGDEGWQIANGVWDRVDPTFPIHAATLDLDAADPFSTLVDNNVFGNKSRFTDEAGVAAVKKVLTSSGLVIDHFKGLMWYAVASGQVAWNTAIDGAVASTQGGFSDWHVAPWTIFRDLLGENTNTGGTAGFPATALNDAWTAQTIAGSTTRAWVTYVSAGEIFGYHQIKTNVVHNYILVRKIY